MHASSSMLTNHPEAHCRPSAGSWPHRRGARDRRGSADGKRHEVSAQPLNFPANALPSLTSRLVMQSAQLADILCCRCAGIGSIAIEQFAGTLLNLAVSD